MHSTASWPRALTYSGPCHRDDTLMSTSSLSVVSSGGWGTWWLMAWAGDPRVGDSLPGRGQFHSLKVCLFSLVSGPQVGPR